MGKIKAAREAEIAHPEGAVAVTTLGPHQVAAPEKAEPLRLEWDQTG